MARKQLTRGLLLLPLIWAGRVVCLLGSLAATVLVVHWLLGSGYLSIGIALLLWPVLWVGLVKATRVGFFG
jgi:hypothetical protein